MGLHQALRAPLGQTVLNLEASKDSKEPEGQKESDGWPCPLQLSLFSSISGETQIPARAMPRPGPPTCFVPEFSSLPTNFSQRSDSILRTWDAFFRRKDCEILGRQLQALPALAGGLVKTLQEDRLWIKCPKDYFSAVEMVGGGGGSNLIKKRRNLLYVSQLWF